MPTFQNMLCLLFLMVFIASPAFLTADELENSQCCSCAFTETAVYEATEDFPCSFAYPAGWDVRYIASDNSVDIRAPRCASPCGSRSLVFSVSEYKNNNADEQERIWQQIANPVGEAQCGGRVVTFFEPAGMDPDGQTGAIAFLVGKNDDKDYDARVIMSCPSPGEWRELEKLIINSLN